MLARAARFWHVRLTQAARRQGATPSSRNLAPLAPAEPRTTGEGRQRITTTDVTTEVTERVSTQVQVSPQGALFQRGQAQAGWGAERAVC